MHRASFAALSLLLAACSQQTDIAAGPCGGADAVVASDAWIREAGDGRDMTAAYVKLCNGGAADRLVGAQFNGAAMVELHASVTDDTGAVSMVPLADGLEIPAGGEAALAPGGAHLMVMGLTGPITDGDEPSITLIFEHAPPLTLSFDVRGVAEAASAHDGH